MSLPADILHAQPHPIWDSRRLWSLADMINFFIGTFLQGLSFLDYEIGLAQAAPQQSDGIVPAPQHDRIKNNINGLVVKECVVRLRLMSCNQGCLELEDLFRRHDIGVGYKYSELYNALCRLRRDIMAAIKQEKFFHYPGEVAALAHPVAEGFQVGNEWQHIVVSFKSAKREIEAGMDCFAFGDYPGCIFHMIRMAEMGLRAMARERGIRSVRNNKPIEYAMWGEVIGALQNAIQNIENPPGKNRKPLTAKQRERREKALHFYRTIISDMSVLNGLRDRTVHLRDGYDRGEAFTSISRTHEMMTTISSKIDEHNTRKIKWGL